MTADLEDLEKLNALNILSSKNQREGSLDQTKNDEFIFPVADGTAKPGRDCQIPSTHSKAGTNLEGVKI